MGGESKDRRSSGKTGRSACVTVRRQMSGKALVWISAHRCRERHWSGFQHPTANLCDSLHVNSPSWPSPYRAGQFTLEAPSVLTACSFTSLAPSQVLESLSPLQHTCSHHPAVPKAKASPSPGGAQTALPSTAPFSTQTQLWKCSQCLPAEGPPPPPKKRASADHWPPVFIFIDQTQYIYYITQIHFPVLLIRHVKAS